MNSFFDKKEIDALGFKSVGDNVMLSRKASIYGASNIEIGNNVRIDDFCILSGKITLKSNIHIAAYSALYGSDVGIYIENFANISSRVCIYAISDDYTGETMTNPTIPDKYKNLEKAPVTIGNHVIVGTGSTILPGVDLKIGTAVGAMSLVKKSTEPWKIYAGIPAKPIKERTRNLLELERCYLEDEN